MPAQSQEVPLQVKRWKCCHLRSAVPPEFSWLSSSNVAFQNQTSTAAAYQRVLMLESFLKQRFADKITEQSLKPYA